MWIVYAIGSALLAGAVAILAKLGVRQVDATVATAVRTTMVLGFTWLIALLTIAAAEPALPLGEALVYKLQALTPQHWLFLGLSGVATGVSWLAYFKALRHGDVNKVAPVDKSSLIMTMLLAVVILGEPLSVAGAYAMVLIGIGTYAMIEPKAGSGRATRGYGWLMYAVAAAVAAALTAILAKIGMQGVDSSLGTALRTIVVLVMAWLMVLVSGKQAEVRRIDRRSMLFLGLSALATGGSWLLYFAALQQGPASVVVPIDKLSIVPTVLFSVLILREKVSPRALLGLVVIVAGTLLLVLQP
ncbi:MAG: EamA family transporter [Candidatus Saccharibacteria bacterium]|nr:EamA family transporter [Candidatus Saccharibacteria bacterium]